MRCPNCNSENNDGAKFCKKCGTPLQKKAIGHENKINAMSENSGDDNTTKYIIIALVVIAVVLAGAFVYLYGFGNNNSQDDSTPVVQNTSNQSVQNDSDDVATDDSDSQKTTTKTSTSSSSKSSGMSIKGGSFETSGGLEDLTYASIYVGPEHSGEKVTIQIFYSRDGSSLNDGNMVPKTVDSSGYINVRSAEAYKYFPDHADINLYDSSGNNLLDSLSVSLSPESGTQTF